MKRKERDFDYERDEREQKKRRVEIRSEPQKRQREDPEFPEPTKRATSHVLQVSESVLEQFADYSRARRFAFTLSRQAHARFIQSELEELRKDIEGIGLCRLRYWRINRVLLEAETSRRTKRQVGESEN